MSTDTTKRDTGDGHTTEGGTVLLSLQWPPAGEPGEPDDGDRLELVEREYVLYVRWRCPGIGHCEVLSRHPYGAVDKAERAGAAGYIHSGPGGRPGIYALGDAWGVMRRLTEEGLPPLSEHPATMRAWVELQVGREWREGPSSKEVTS